MMTMIRFCYVLDLVCTGMVDSGLDGVCWGCLGVLGVEKGISFVLDGQTKGMTNALYKKVDCAS